MGVELLGSPQWCLPSPQGIYTGGLAHANEMVQSGRAQAREFRLLNGYSFWPRGALDQEVARGGWWLIAASPAFVLSLISGVLFRQQPRAAWSRVVECGTAAGPA